MSCETAAHTPYAIKRSSGHPTSIQEHPLFLVNPTSRRIGGFFIVNRSSAARWFDQGAYTEIVGKSWRP